MFQEFFTDTIESKFIKSLLRNTPIPIYPSISDEDYVINGCTYVNDYGVVRCTETGIAKDAKFTRLFPYIFNINEKSFTENYISKYNYYDTETHEKLGNYLRVYRDLNKVDLMPFYNCFSYRFFEDIYLDKSKSCGYVEERNSSYKVIAIPIKFDKIYTIAIDSNSTIAVKSFLHDNLGPLKLKDGIDYRYITEELKDCLVTLDNKDYTNDSCVLVPQSSFNNPIHYKISVKKSRDSSEDFSDEYKRRLKNLEKYLYLIVQVPSDNKSSIVVLEGDYSNNDINENYFSMDYSPDVSDETYDEYVEEILNQNYINSNLFNSSSVQAFNFIVDSMYNATENSKNKYLLSNLSLLQMSTSQIYAFNNRLIEYLLLNVIDNTETIDNNVTRVQEILKLTNRLDIIPSVWSDRMRCDLYKKYMSSKFQNKEDINGFVDKDIEKMLIKMDGDF